MYNYYILNSQYQVITTVTSKLKNQRIIISKYSQYYIFRDQLKNEPIQFYYQLNYELLFKKQDIILIYKPVKYKKRKFNEIIIDYKKMLNVYITKLNIKKIRNAKTCIDKINKRKIEHIYRANHHSFKMYYLNDSNIELLENILNLLGIKKDNLNDNIHQLEFFNIIVKKTVMDSLNTQFCMNRNMVFVEDYQKLAGCFLMLETLLSTLIKFSEDIINNTYELKQILNSESALFLEMYKPFSKIRYSKNYDQFFLTLIKAKFGT